MDDVEESVSEVISGNWLLLSDVVVFPWRQATAETVKDLLSREAMLKNEIEQLRRHISELHHRRADEMERLGSEKTVDVPQLMNEPNGLEHRGETELDLVTYYQRHLEAVEQIDELRHALADRQTDIDNLRESLQCREAEIERLTANDRSDGGLVAAVQLGLDHVTAER